MRLFGRIELSYGRGLLDCITLIPRKMDSVKGYRKRQKEREREGKRE